MNKQATKVVVIGGGSGISVILRGLKQYTEHISAIVTVADDGGSSGVIREDLGMLPPGDIRNCIVALSEAEPLMARLMQHRFKSGQFAGHSLGNMIIAGLTDMQGSFDEALANIHDIFAVTGRVLPVSLDDIVLYAKLEDGNVVRGESNIPNVVKWNKTAIDKVFIDPADAKAYPESVTAILDADLVLIGPGSLYTSIMPSLLMPEIKTALCQTAAKVVVSMNLMTQPGETDAMTVGDHLDVLIDRIGADTIDYLLVNNQTVSSAAAERYAKKGAHLLKFSAPERSRISALGIKIVEGDFLEEYAGYVRHDAAKFSQQVLNLVDTVRYIPHAKY
ncbi:MAG: hypothetical protein CSB19_02160 [Clostridiales bacterium]|nr:MAG: hypothetical protein CSB19_02160 [Clostridiales bacterium]